MRPSEGRPRDTQKQGLSRPKDPKRGTNRVGQQRKKKLNVREHGTKWGRREDRETNRIVQVCRVTDQEV